jgi:hypothetical protein
VKVSCCLPVAFFNLAPSFVCSLGILLVFN